MADLLDRIASKINFTDDCWLWTGATRTDYGVIRVGSQKDGTRRMAPAHRALYELVAEPIPEGVNPDHLEPVTPVENKRRADGWAGVNARKTHCIHGHKFTVENTRIDGNGRRRCRACNRADGAASRARSRDRAERQGGGAG